MKYTDTSLLLWLGLVPLLACATTLPPPAREAPDLCVIGIAVSISAPLWGHTQAEYVYFVRLDDSETYGHYRPIRSNYTSGKYVYLFNAQPGRYAVVAAGYQRQSQGAPVGSSMGIGGGFSVGASVTPTHSNTFTAYLPSALIKSTVVTVGEAEVAFLGEVVLDERSWEDADDVQLHYYRLLAPGHEDSNFLMKALSGQHHEAGIEHELDQGRATRRKFLEHSQRELADADWASLFQNPVASGPPTR